MQYKDFKKIIESVSVVNEQLYNEIVEKIGKNDTSTFFELYINDTEVADDINKINRTSYYIEKCSEKESIEDNNLENYADVMNVDVVKAYLKEIGNVPLLTPEEEVVLANKICILKEKIKKNSITIEEINNNLFEFGYSLKINNNNVSELDNKKFFLKKKIKELEESEKKDNLDKVNVTLNKLEQYYEYKELVDKFISANLRLVVSIAKKYVGRGLEFLDLIQEGNVGLSRAIEKFDVNKGYKFSTYATWWIRQAITRSIADYGKTIRLPVHFNELINKVNLVEANLTKKLGRRPTEEEIVEVFREKAKQELIANGLAVTPSNIDEMCKINLEKLKDIRLHSNNIISLSTPINEEEDTFLSDFIPDENMNVESSILNELNSDYILNLFSSLKQKERLVLIFRKGLSLNKYMSPEEFVVALSERKPKLDIETITKLYEQFSRNQVNLTLENVGLIYGVSRERVRQIEARGMKKLRIKTRGDQYYFNN